MRLKLSSAPLNNLFLCGGGGGGVYVCHAIVSLMQLVVAGGCCCLHFVYALFCFYHFFLPFVLFLFYFIFFFNLRGVVQHWRCNSVMTDSLIQSDPIPGDPPILKWYQCSSQHFKSAP